jgi:hypothetical protein
MANEKLTEIVRAFPETHYSFYRLGRVLDEKYDLSLSEDLDLFRQMVQLVHRRARKCLEDIQGGTLADCDDRRYAAQEYENICKRISELGVKIEPERRRYD